MEQDPETIASKVAKRLDTNNSTKAPSLFVIEFGSCIFLEKERAKHLNSLMCYWGKERGLGGEPIIKI